MTSYLTLLTCLLLATSPGAVYSVGTCKPFTNNGVCGKTPMTLREYFDASCLAFGARNRNTCSMAWEAFQGAFADVDPQAVQANNYQPYLDILPVEALPDQSLFWSRTSSLVDILSMMNAMVTVVSSANTPSSKVITDIAKRMNISQLNWCGSVDGGIDFVNNCSCNVTAQFWKKFSLEFSKVATGNTFYLTDGEDACGAYRNNSFFASVELPNMNDRNITRVIALVIHREGEGESCDSNCTIQNLRNDVGDRFGFDCYDIYGLANDSSQAETIASCVASVISNVQRGLYNPVADRKIECVSSSVTVQVSLLLLLTVLTPYLLALCLEVVTL